MENEIKSEMKNLVNSQEREFWNLFYDEGGTEEYEKCEKILDYIAKCRKETAECVKKEEKDRILSNVGLLRQWLNERTESMELITNKDIEAFLSR